MDAFIAAPKTLLGVTGDGDWQRQEDTEGGGLEYRIVWPISVTGVARATDAGASLVIVGHPNDVPQTWHLNLLFGGARVAGLDVEHDDRPHSNSLRRAGQDVPYKIKGSHAHLWDDNKHLATLGALPVHLHIARLLPDSLATNSSNRFSRTLYWFCEQQNIVPPSATLTMPPRYSLLV